jgi:hypothetical protein
MIHRLTLEVNMENGKPEEASRLMAIRSERADSKPKRWLKSHIPN